MSFDNKILCCLEISQTAQMENSRTVPCSSRTACVRASQHAQVLIRSRSHKIERWKKHITLKFQGWLGSTAADTPVKFQSNLKILNLNRVALRLQNLTMQHLSVSWIKARVSLRNLQKYHAKSIVISLTLISHHFHYSDWLGCSWE